MQAIAKAYDPGSVEDRWFAAWEEGGCFEGNPDPGRNPYCILIPPPNVTGVLTMGHVLNNTIQDVLIRRARQQGHAALWLPGTDHAGIATQTRVEKSLRAEGKSRRDLGREAFVKHAEEWRDKHGGIILRQLRKLGASCDWRRTVHTLDPAYSRAVLTAFVRLFERGYIYRGKRMVNWCPVSQTALSDEEVIMKPQQSRLYHMRYEVVEEPGRFLSIATTRPETIMGDSGVAVHPDDERYRDLIGKHVWRPFPREAIPVVADTAVEREFGTGVLKVTPAHDVADFEIGQRHGLPVIEVLHPDGTLNELAGEPFAGMDRFEARIAAAKRLDELGLLDRVEEYENSVGFSERADVPIEPRLSEQWFLRYPKISEARAVVQDGIIRFHPRRWEKTYLHWLENIKDWCISRQLWWGHRIPVWYRKGADRSDPANWHVSIDGPGDPENWEQDEDVLDTWASSWLWPLATMGWPDPEAEREQGLHYFFPTSALVTGPDIIFFWVARMIIASLEFYGEERDHLDRGEMERRIPFRDVYFTGIIRDGEGRKMSKSLGNSPDPLDLIAKFGADGLRFGILSIAPQGQDIRFSEERIEQGRNFCNKLWNACRFRQLSGGDEVVDSSTPEAILDRIQGGNLSVDDRAILERLARLTAEVGKAFDEFQFNQAVQALYAFFWTDFCDWYVEVSKARVQNPETRATALGVQDYVLRQLLILLHPFTPFITEELWHLLGFGTEGAFLQNAGPIPMKRMREQLEGVGLEDGSVAVAEVDLVRGAVTQVRALKAEFQLSARRDVTVKVVPADGASPVLRRNRAVIQATAGLASLEEIRAEDGSGPTVLADLGTFYLDLAGSVDVDAERKRLGKELSEVEGHIAATMNRLENPRFVDKAPSEVVEGARKQLADLREKREEVLRLLQSL